MMDRNLAERMVKAIDDLNQTMNALDSLSAEIADENESRKFRRTLGTIMAESVGLLMPIIRQFPDLDPDR
jgi:hypothetical protein